MRSLVVYRLVVALVLLLCSVPSICRGQQERAKEAGGYNLILIDITCLRADHLSSYGYSRETSPNIDKLAREEIWFAQAVSQAYWTLPSVASVFTGKYVSSHKLENRNQRLEPDQLTLAEVLKRQGYSTAAFVGGLDLDAIHGLSRGFEVYSDDTGNKPMGSLAQIFPQALGWLDQNRQGRFFLFLQGYDMHPPFAYPAEYENKFDLDYRGVLDQVKLDYDFLKSIGSDAALLGGSQVKLEKKDISHIIAHYDGGISYVDSLLGDFLSQLEKSGLAEKTVVLIFADHGEELYDHGSFDRFGKANLYEEVVHVPLFIKHPKIKRVKIDQQVQLIDIFPTVLDLLDVYSLDGFQGRSLYPLLTACFPPVRGEYAFGGWGRKEMVRGAGWKLIFDGKEFELYDIVNDRREENNCINKNTKMAVRLSEELFNWHVNNNLIMPSGKIRVPPEEMPGYYRKWFYDGEDNKEN